jgi:hypothetical protein
LLPDVEGDDIVISSDEELIEALVEHSGRGLQNEAEFPFKMHVKLVNNGSATNNGPGGDVTNDAGQMLNCDP